MRPHRVQVLPRDRLTHTPMGRCFSDPSHDTAPHETPQVGRALRLPYVGSQHGIMLLGFILVEEQQSQTLSAVLGQGRARWQKGDLVTMSL